MADGAVADAPDTEELAEMAARGPDFDASWSIWQRVNAVMQVVGFVEKDQKVKIGQGGGYDYVSHDMVTAVIRPACVRYGIGVMPSVIEHQKDGNRTELTVETSFVNIHKPEDKITIKTYGYGVDSSDKGPGKAFSYAVKYAYLKMFLLNSADDIESDNIQHDPAQPRASEVTAAQIEATEAMHAWAETYKSALEGASTLEELVDVQRKNAKALASDRLPDLMRKTLIDIGKKRKADLTPKETD